MKNCFYLLSLLGLFLFACQPKAEDKKTEVDTSKEDAVSCIEQIIAKDSEAGKIRNHACEKIPLSETIKDYVKAMKDMDYSNCPIDFSTAFEKHAQAWEASMEITDLYPDLRGEMHDLFDQIEGGKDSTVFKQKVKAIWDTWGEVEAAMEAK